MVKRPPACSFVRAIRGPQLGNEIASIEPRDSLMARNTASIDMGRISPKPG